jgi:hypothetical protein
MSAPVQNGSAKGAAKPTDKKELKILMLHGKISTRCNTHVEYMAIHGLLLFNTVAAGII